MFKMLGITDEITTCEACGRSNLKRTVVLESETTGLVHYGTDCAAVALYGVKSSKNRKLVEDHAKAVAYAKKWIGIHGNDPTVLEKIATTIRVRFCPAYVAKGLLFVNGEEILI